MLSSRKRTEKRDEGTGPSPKNEKMMGRRDHQKFYTKVRELNVVGNTSDPSTWEKES